MSLSIRYAPLCLIAVLLLVGPGTTTAQLRGFLSRDADLGLTAAFLLPSDEIAAEDFNVKVSQNGTVLARLYADFYIIPRLSMGVYVNFAPTSYGESSETATMLEFGGSLKARFVVGRGSVAIKPGVNFGYRLFMSDFKYADAVKGFGIGPSIEVQFAVGSVVAPHLEIGFLSQPAGGNEYTNVTFPPIFYFGGGLSLGL